MSLDRSALFGKWNIYSAQVMCELDLHDDGSYALTVWSGAQSVWGQWQVEDHGGQGVLALTAQGANPPMFLNQFGPGPVVERHAVVSVQANQIQLFDALMVRQYVAPVMPQPPVPQAFPVPQWPAGPRFPSLAPYSAPPLPPPPAFQASPIMNQFRAAGGALNQTVASMQAQTFANDWQTTQNIANGEAAFNQYQIQENKKLHDFQIQKQHESNVDFMMAMNGYQRVG